MKGVTSIVGAVASDMGILTTPQLHWMVRARNKGIKAAEQDYFEQLTSSFRSVQSFPNSVMMHRYNSALFLSVIDGETIIEHILKDHYVNGSGA
jgi:phosphoacetylglucosamine mutase